ncbi:MAG: LytR family transcriptional regulator [Acidimicrobiia bacterium]|nr:LytR family transcriptional regulator [Acidimicrobiia bacterium]
MSRKSEQKALRRLAEMSSTPTPPTSGETPTSSGRGPTRAVLSGLVLPGVPSFRRRPALSYALLFTGVVLPLAVVVVTLVRRNELTRLVLDQNVLRALEVVGVLFVLARVVAVIEAVRARTENSPKRLASVMAVAGVMLMLVPTTYAVTRVHDLAGVISDVFVSSGSSDPLAGTSGTDDDPFTTVLLLGGDEGPGRWAMRTDSMILVIIHRASGRIAMVSVPRNLNRVQFPPGSAMANEFPKGFDGLANAIYPYVYTHEDVAASYLRGELQPEAVALASGLSYSFNIAIDDYVLVNMQGFLELVDVLGGVTLTLDEKIPMPGNVPGAKHDYPPYIGPGEVEMDGTIALGFARSRSGDSDYGRMGRQRQLLSALAAQASGVDVLRKFPDLAEVMRWTVRTSLNTDEFSFLVERLQDGAAVKESVGLAPPIINPGSPDFDTIATLIDTLQYALAENIDFPYA